MGYEILGIQYNTANNNKAVQYDYYIYCSYTIQCKNMSFENAKNMKIFFKYFNINVYRNYTYLYENELQFFGYVL